MREQNELRKDPTSIINDLENFRRNSYRDSLVKSVLAESIGEKNIDGAVRFISFIW